MTKAEFQLSQERIDNRFIQMQQYIEGRFKDSEHRIIARLGFISISTTTIAVALLTWLI